MFHIFLTVFPQSKNKRRGGRDRTDDLLECERRETDRLKGVGGYMSVWCHGCGPNRRVFYGIKGFKVR